jgi:hypothetical protein
VYNAPSFLFLLDPKKKTLFDQIEEQTLDFTESKLDSSSGFPSDFLITMAIYTTATTAPKF